MTNFFNVILNKNMNINNNTIINYSNHLKKGYLELIIGPMFAGKSTELIRIIKNYQVLNCKILTINHSINCRYGSDNIITHDLIEMKSNISLNDLSLLLKDDLLLDKILNADVIVIEELQFFDNAFNTIVSLIDHYNKVVIAAGLDGDYKKNPFGDVLRLIPHAEKIIKLSSLCKKCNDGTPAHFTKRINNSNPNLNIDSVINVGNNNEYEAVCRFHFIND